MGNLLRGSTLNYSIIIQGVEDLDEYEVEVEFIQDNGVELICESGTSTIGSGMITGQIKAINTQTIDFKNRLIQCIVRLTDNESNVYTQMDASAFILVNFASTLTNNYEQTLTFNI